MNTKPRQRYTTEFKDQAVDTARRLVTLFDDDTRRTQQSGRSAANALRVLAALRQRPMLSLPQLCQLNAMTFPAANKTMAQLVAAGIARELTGQRRNRVFSYDAYLSSNSPCRRTPIPRHQIPATNKPKSA